ncbi:MLO-like protein 11 [Morus notabilis]|uniref:MLO-like protein n=1 Tax=Morus notabilis TaxID=981085 RepID=W9RH09_9ROSA|nr:MLO-like protein 11 [Morus notabilis]
MEENSKETRSLALTPTWSVATVLTIFVAVSLLVERSIHRLSNWLRKTNRKPLLEAVEKMKEELMLLGFISLLLTATSSIIANICIPSKFYNSAFAPCTRSEIDEETEDNSSDEQRKLLMSPGHEPFVSSEGLEQLHRFIFVMAVTHVSYSCLTMLLAIVKVHSWRVWEDEAHMDRHDSLTEITRHLTMRRQSTFVKVHVHTSTPPVRNSLLIWVTCFFRQFGHSVVRADYLTLRKGFIMNHNLTLKYDFHSYMIRSMEEEFQRIVGVSGPLWGFVVAFMLFNIKGSNLYFWIAIIPITMTKYGMTMSRQSQSLSEVSSSSEAVTTNNNGISDGLIQSIIGHKLNGQNYLYWSQSVMMFVCGKGKEDYLSGADPKYKLRKAENNMVMSWLINSMTNEIRENFLLYGTAKEIWDAAKETYSNFDNSSELFSVESILHDRRQGDLSVTQYFNTLTRNWQ